MFTKVLIANRGEIACRIIRTLRELALAVSPYIRKLTPCRHVREADEGGLYRNGICGR